MTKNLVKEKVNIKRLPVGITKIKKGSKGSIILGCESEKEIIRFKETVQEKLGEDFDIVEPIKKKPKLKIINISEEIMKLNDEDIIESIKKQNEIEGKVGGSYIKIVKKIIKGKKEDKIQTRGRRRREDGSLIIEVDKWTHKQIKRREKLNIGWRKCTVFEYHNVKRCFKCWGYYHIAKNCTRRDTCYK